MCVEVAAHHQWYPQGLKVAWTDAVEFGRFPGERLAVDRDAVGPVAAVQRSVVGHACRHHTGQMFAFFIIAAEAAEVAVGLAIVLSLFRIKRTVRSDEADLLRN